MLLLPILPTGNDPIDKVGKTTDQVVDWFAAHGLNILIIILMAILARIAAGWLIRRAIRGMLSSGNTLRSVTTMVGRKVASERDREMANNRRLQRAETISQVCRHVVSAAIIVVAAVMILSEMGINVAPIIAGLGVAGVAAGVGAQTIVKDVIAGIMILFEDIIGVGDIVDLEYASGTVENINLRVTQVRSIDGVLWTVRNGEIIRIGNKSRGFATAIVLLDLDSGNDDETVTQTLLQICDESSRDPEFKDRLLDKPVLSGILSVDGARYQRRLSVKVAPGTQWDVEQDLRRRVREAFNQKGLNLALPRFQETQR